jgi:hypothetical protein
MQSLITVLLILAIIALPVQMTLINRRFVVYIGLLLISAFVFFVYPRAIEQSYTTFQRQIGNLALIENFIVIQIIEALGGILLSIFLIRLHYNEPVKKTFRYLKYIPGIIVFPALFYLVSYLFIIIPGIGFQRLAILLACIIPALLLALKHLVQRLISELDLRLELKFLLHIFQILIAIIISIGLFRLPVQGEYNIIPLEQFGGMLAFTFLVVMIGVVFYDVKLRRLKKDING